jgi:hypothetical protein
MAQTKSVMSDVLSFRDPSGRLFTDGKRVLRIVDAPAIPDVMALLNSTRGRHCMDRAYLVKTRVLDRTEAAGLQLKLKGILLASFLLKGVKEGDL